MKKSMVRNAMTVDVEDYFQVSAFASHIDRKDWERLPGRVEHNTTRILELFESHNTRATFFILGWVAQRHPGLMRTIVDAGHEIASHGYSHVRVTEQNPDEFRKDVSETKKILEDLSGSEVRGFRAASFSIGAGTLWAHDVLQETGYHYSSSIYPINHDLYGMPNAPRFPFRASSSDLLEVPITTIRLFGRNIPCGGGGYFRMLPYAYYRWAVRHVNTKDEQPSVFYFHPWEIDPGQPRQTGLSLKTRIRHYTNLGRTEHRLGLLLNDFRWGRMDEVFLSSQPAASGVNHRGDMLVEQAHT